MLDSILTYFKEMWDGVRERMQNPFAEKNATPFSGAFAISFVIYNWKLVFSFFSFDGYLNRQGKIDILMGYLHEEAWYSRIGCPVMIAFASMILYHTFNNLSLAITTFFNRQVKSLILYWFDRGKTMTRDEYEKKVSRLANLKQKHDKTLEELSDSEDEKTKISNQLTELTKSYGTVVAENDRLKLEAKTQTNVGGNAVAGFRISLARYGAESTYRVITDTVQTIFETTDRLAVDNKTLQGDPLKYSVKTLQIVYQNNDVSKEIIAFEGEIVELKNGGLIVHPTEQSRKKQDYLKNLPKLAALFEGGWSLRFSPTTDTGGTSGLEPIVISDDGRYFAHSRFRFFLRTVDFSNDEKTITLNKVDTGRSLHSKETLHVQSKDLVTGTDSKGYKLEYFRQGVAENSSYRTVENRKIRLAHTTSTMTANSDFLKMPECTFNIWAYVTDIHNQVLDRQRFMYIVGHSSNGGVEGNNDHLARYPNAWAIQRLVPMPQNKKGLWRFWCNGVANDLTHLDYEGTLLGGWHLFSVSWSSEKDYIKFLIDGKTVSETTFRNWPRDVAKSVSIGTWPKRSTSQFFESNIGAYESAVGPFDQRTINEFMLKGPGEL